MGNRNGLLWPSSQCLSSPFSASPLLFLSLPCNLSSHSSLYILPPSSPLMLSFCLFLYSLFSILFSAFSLLSFLLEDLPPFAFTVLCIEFSERKSNQAQVIRALGPLGLQHALVGMQGGYSPWDCRRVLLKSSISIWRPRNIQQRIFIIS